MWCYNAENTLLDMFYTISITSWGISWSLTEVSDEHLFLDRRVCNSSRKGKQETIDLESASIDEWTDWVNEDAQKDSNLILYQSRRQKRKNQLTPGLGLA